MTKLGDIYLPGKDDDSDSVFITFTQMKDIDLGLHIDMTIQVGLDEDPTWSTSWVITEAQILDISQTLSQVVITSLRQPT